jgi:hypothetical protein
MKELDEIFGEIKPSAKLDEIISEIKSSAKLDDEHTVLIAFGYDNEPLGWRSVRITPDGYSYDDMHELVMEHPGLRYSRSIEDILSIKNK